MWVLDLEDMQWTYYTHLLCERAHHACCMVRGSVFVLAGKDDEDTDTGGCTASVEVASVEVLRYRARETEEDVFRDLLSLARGAVNLPIAISIDESESDEGQVLLIGGADVEGTTSKVHIVDLATGVC